MLTSPFRGLSSPLATAKTPGISATISGRSARAQRRLHARRARRRGVVAVYFAFLSVILLGVCAIVVDEGYWFYRQAEMQKAADAAAMAGAGALISGSENSAEARSRNAVRDIAKANGCDPADPKFTLSWRIGEGEDNNKLYVGISAPEPTFFGQIYGQKKVDIAVSSIAEFARSTPLFVPITGGTYGVNSGPINLGLYGPEQITNRGDLYSARFTTDSNGKLVPNPDYRPGGYSFAVSIPDDFGNKATVEIYDADSTASGPDASADLKVWDENNKDRYVLDKNGNVVKSGKNATTITRYTLWSDNGTPLDYSDDTEIDSSDIGADPNYDQQWKNFFNFNPRQLRNKFNSSSDDANAKLNFRISAETISGSNENGFNLRITKPGDTDATFANGGNGTDISAIGDIPVNFGRSGTGVIALGYVPKSAKNIHIDQFDLDTGVAPGSRVSYFYKNGTSRVGPFLGNPLAGSSKDNLKGRDDIQLPNGYQGGDWEAVYTAGGSDNSTWSLTHDGESEKPGYVRLVG